MFLDAKNYKGIIHVAEQGEDGKLKTWADKAPYIAYEEDKYGTCRSITGQRLRKVHFKNRQAIEEAKQEGRKLWESDVNPTFRFLEKRYPEDDQLPDFRITFYDIEVDRDPEKGYATTRNPFSEVISITLYHKWLDRAITIAVPPMPMDRAIVLLNDEHHKDGYGRLNRDNGYYLVPNEEVLLELFLDLINIEGEETTILSGWNNQGFDLPYLIGRIRIVLGEEPIDKVKEDTEFTPTPKSGKFLKRLCLFNMLPDMKQIEKFGNQEQVYEIYGRRDVDYLAFYKKFIKAELLSFTLDAILQLEVGQTKVKFDGTIDQFYRREFRRFLAYNRQDVMGLSAIDDKRRLINLANQMIHMAGVTIDKAIKSVPIIEQAILRVLHRERNEIAWDKTEHEIDRHVPGAFVVEPKAGKYGWGGSYDVNSLYPTMIRLLNISPETMIGQLDTTRTERRLNEWVDDILKIDETDRDYKTFAHRQNKNAKAVDQAFTEAWHRFTGVLEYHDVIEGSDCSVILEKRDGHRVVLPGHAMKKLIQDSNWCITANGTVFDLSREGIIPYCLTKWYNERSEYRRQAQEAGKQALALRDTDPAKSERLSKQAEYFDMVQAAKKLFLNSTYGAYLNRHFRFYDPQCGRSVTLSGRVVVKHMCKKSCEILSGKYEFTDAVLLGGDTDSNYISYESFLDREGLEKSAENAIAVGDVVGAMINESFPEHLSEQFLIPKDRVAIVEVKRETIFDRAIFKNEKKRYALHVIDAEGKRIPKGHKDELKVIGLEVKRSDTPKYIQEFLQECLRLVLVEGYEEDQLRGFVDHFRAKFRSMPRWKRGSPVRVSKLQIGTQLLNKYQFDQDSNDPNTKKPLIYWAVTAAINTNRLMDENKEARWEKLYDGDKVDVLYLIPTEHGADRVAIRVGEEWIPEWFQRLPFDDAAHEKKLIDAKLINIFGGLGWNFEARDHSGWDIFC